MEISNPYGTINSELNYIMSKTPASMTAEEKDIWRKETLVRVSETTRKTQEMLKEQKKRGSGTKSRSK